MALALLLLVLSHCVTKTLKSTSLSWNRLYFWKRNVNAHRNYIHRNMNHFILEIQLFSFKGLLATITHYRKNIVMTYFSISFLLFTFFSIFSQLCVLFTISTASPNIVNSTLHHDGWMPFSATFQIRLRIVVLY